MHIRFTVHGRPQPQGSTKAFIPKGWNRAVVTTDNTKLKPWRQDVSSQALLAMQNAGLQMRDGAVEVNCTFCFSKPKSTKASATQKTTKPDLDKLVRGIYDGLKGICFVDDSQVVSTHATKCFVYGGGERAEIEVRGIFV